MRERRRREWCDRGERSSVFRRKMRPRSGMLTPQIRFRAVVTPRRWPIPLCGSLGQRFGVSFARSLTKQIACKAPSRPGCSKIRRSLRCAPRHRSPSYDLRRVPRDHSDFDSNALRGGFVQRSPRFSPDPVSLPFRLTSVFYEDYISGFRAADC